MQVSHVTLMIKPVGALCNLNCTYCYYLRTGDEVFNGHVRRMSTDTLRDVFAGALPRFGPEVTIAWQGGEPMLAGLDFFRQAVDFVRQHQLPGQQVSHALQTNATLIDDDWCAFLREQKVLVGVSIDGPPHFHNRYRRDRAGEPSADAVLKGLRKLQQHGVEYNILCVLNDRNVEHPDEVLGYLLNTGSRWVQFIPAIEWEHSDGNAPDSLEPAPRLAPYSPTGEAYGRFLCRIFDLWFERYRQSLSIRIVDAVLNELVLGQMPFCILAGACHNQITIEHDGSIFGCDHFVSDRWRLGSIQSPGDDGWLARVDEAKLTQFADRKQSLPAGCQSCEFRRFCYGGCPKHRPHGGDVPEASVLCAGYKAFFAHAMPRLQWLAGYLKQRQMPPAPTVAKAPSGDAPSRNAACPCGSGLKYKRCHGRA
jgi:uncharacterized protein